MLDYKKQERVKGIEGLDNTLADKKGEVDSLSARLKNFDEGLERLDNVEQLLDTAPEYQLTEPQAFMSAKAYKTKVAEPLIKKLKSLIKTALVKCFEAWDNYHRLNVTNGNLYRENERLSKVNAKLKDDNDVLRAENKDYKLLRKIVGSKQIDSLLEQAKASKRQKVKGR